jgi:ribose transport system permease protein
MTANKVDSPDANLPPSDSRAAELSKRETALLFLAKYGTLIGLVIMILVFSIAEPNAFPTFNNFRNIVNQASLAAIISGGLTIALIVGEFDLSIGYHASLAGVLVTGLIVRSGLPIVASIVLVLMLGAFIGFVNGTIVTKLRVNAVIGTLGLGTVLTGLTFAYTAGKPIASGVPNAFTEIALGRIWGIPHNVLIMAAVIGVLWVMVNRTDLGQYFQAVGGNQEAARLSGIPVDRVKNAAFITAGVCAAITGFLLASLLGSGTASAGDSYLLDAFAATFLGSATFRNGEFHVLGTLFGVIFIAIGFNGLALIGAQTYWQFLFKGSVLIAAVALSTVARRLARG